MDEFNPVAKLIQLAQEKYNEPQYKIAERVGEDEKHLSKMKNGKRDLPLFKKFLAWCEILQIKPSDCLNEYEKERFKNL